MMDASHIAFKAMFLLLYHLQDIKIVVVCKSRHVWMCCQRENSQLHGVNTVVTPLHLITDFVTII